MNELQNIDAITAEILILKQQTAQNIIEIGKRLITVKGSLPHGEWGKYLSEKVDFTERTAQRFMKVANEISNTTTLSDLPKSKVFALLDLPPDERESFAKENDINNMTARELQQAIKEKKELEDKLKAAENKADLERKALESINNSYKKLEKINKTNEGLKQQLESVKNKNKEELTNKEVEIENLKQHIEDIKSKMSAAESSGDNEEVEKLQSFLNETENKLSDANAKIQDLERQLKEKPIEVVASPEVIEKVPEEVEKELQELREKVNQASSNNEPVVKFSVYFSELVNNFKGLLGSLSDIKEPETQEKYKKAVLGLIDKMAEKL